MGHFKGIGPTKYGSADKNSNTTPCGTPKVSPLDASAAQNAAFGPDSKLAAENPERAAQILDGINEADSGTNYGTPLPMLVPGAMGSIAQNIGSIFSKRRRGPMEGGASAQGAAQMAAAGAQAQSIGGGSSGMQADVEGLQTKLADLKSQIDNLANSV
jgi:hypothetical protein